MFSTGFIVLCRAARNCLHSVCDQCLYFLDSLLQINPEILVALLLLNLFVKTNDVFPLLVGERYVGSFLDEEKHIDGY